MSYDMWLWESDSKEWGRVKLEINSFVSMNLGILSRCSLCSSVMYVVISMFASSVVDHWFEPQLCQTEDYKIDICCFTAKDSALRNKSKDGLAWNQDNKSE